MRKVKLFYFPVAVVLLFLFGLYISGPIGPIRPDRAHDTAHAIPAGAGACREYCTELCRLPGGGGEDMGDPGPVIGGGMHLLCSPWGWPSAPPNYWACGWFTRAADCPDGWIK